MKINQLIAVLAATPADAPVKAPTCRVLSIDSWNGPDGWTWNNWFKVDDVPASLTDKSARVILKELRKRFILTDASKGKVRIERDEVNLTIIQKSNNEPILAIELVR